LRILPKNGRKRKFARFVNRTNKKLLEKQFGQKIFNLNRWNIRKNNWEQARIQTLENQTILIGKFLSSNFLEKCMKSSEDRGIKSLKLGIKIGSFSSKRP